MNKVVDWEEVSKLLDELYQVTDRLEVLFPGRKFTLDGHLVGSIGEVIAAYMFDLDLRPGSSKAHDAEARNDGRLVEVKLTQGDRVAIRHEPEHLIVLQRKKGSRIDVVFNGPGAVAWQRSGTMGRNGQQSVGINALRQLNNSIADEQRLPIKRQAPV